MYTAGNRSFDTYEQAAQYCTLVDFDFYEMIQYKGEEGVISPLIGMNFYSGESLRDANLKDLWMLTITVVNLGLWHITENCLRKK